MMVEADIQFASDLGVKRCIAYWFRMFLEWINNMAVDHTERLDWVLVDRNFHVLLTRPDIL